MANAVVTGANRGIGLEFTRQLLARGDRVWAGARHPESSPELLELSQQYGPEALTLLPLDVTHALQRANLFASVGAATVDLLVCNAGVYGPTEDRLGVTDEAAWIDAFRVNAIAPRQLVEGLLPALLRSTHPVIALLTSKMGSMADNGSGGAYIYRSSKAALNAIGVSMARDLGARGVTTLLLHPGWVRTRMGGPHGEIDATQSVSALLHTVDHAGPADNGRFIDIQGETIPW
jgi:NAD(P)-dependent dehydrogenase (short-subunit alcohol dehydrogenase family)